MSRPTVSRSATVESAVGQSFGSGIPALRLGILADKDSLLKRQKSLIALTRHTMAYGGLIEHQSIPMPENIDAWIVYLEGESDSADELIEQLHDLDVPVIIEDIKINRQPPVDADSARIFEARIHQSVSMSQESGKPYKAPEFVWVLAASAGGPQAVAEFLLNLGDNASQCAFFYAQHIDQQALPSLLVMLKRQCSLQVKVCDVNQAIEAGVLYLITPEYEVEFLSSKRIALTGQKWRGVYTPSINQVIAKVARTYGERCGAVVFSGMGDDGKESIGLMNAVGGEVYAQSPESCALDSMPLSAIETGFVRYIGSIESLSEKVIERSCAGKVYE